MVYFNRMSMGPKWRIYKHRGKQSLHKVNQEKVQVGNDQLKEQSERDSHSKNRGGKKLN